MVRHQFCRNYILNGGDIFTLQRIADVQKYQRQENTSKDG